MLRALRILCCTVVVVLVSAAGCDEKPRKNSTTPSSPAASASPVDPSSGANPSPTTVSSSAQPTDLPTRLSVIANRTGFSITHNGQPIDTAGLRALGWTLNAALGTAQWTDPALGSMSVTWELPDSRAISNFDVSFWGDVTGTNLAMNPTMSTTGFTGGPVEATAYSTGAKAETPTKRMVVTVTEQAPGATAQVHMNLGWPQPVLITYNYVYE